MDILNYIDELIEENNKQIKELEKNIIKKMTFDEFTSFNFEKMEYMLKEYNISEIAYKLDTIMNYFRCKRESDIYISSLKKLSIEMEKIFSEITRSIDSLNGENVNKRLDLQEINDILFQVKKVLENTLKYSDEVYVKINDMVFGSNIDDDKYRILMTGVYSYLLNLNKINLEKFETAVRENMKSEVVINNISNDDIKNKVLDIVNMLQDSNSEYYLENFTYEVFSIDYLDMVKEEFEKEKSSEHFGLLIGIYINEILNNSNYEYYTELCDLFDLYKKCVDKKTEIGSKVIELSNKIENLNNTKSGYINKVKVYLSEVEGNTDFMIGDKYYGDTVKKLSEYIQAIDYEISFGRVERKPITTLNNFVLFACDEEAHTYFISDLYDPKNNLIDNSTSPVIEHYREITDLLLDLFEYGKPAYLNSTDSKNSTGADRIFRHIYYKTKKGDVDKKNPTDMWRIRPTLSSNVRFAERKIVIQKTNKELYKQVIAIVKKCLPHIEIDETKDFTFFVNIGVAIKKSDDELYRESIKRYDSGDLDIMQIFYKEDEYRTKCGATLKEKFDENDEYSPLTLEQYINRTLQELRELGAININFKFGPLLGSDEYEFSKRTY